jgi:hypothetical protein
MEYISLAATIILLLFSLNHQEADVNNQEIEIICTDLHNQAWHTRSEILLSPSDYEKYDLPRPLIGEWHPPIEPVAYNQDSCTGPTCEAEKI